MNRLAVITLFCLISLASFCQGNGPAPSAFGGKPSVTGGKLDTNIQSSDSPSIDAFGRWRVSNPQTLFDSKNIFDDDGVAIDAENQPLFYDNQQISGAGTTTDFAWQHNRRRS